MNTVYSFGGPFERYNVAYLCACLLRSRNRGCLTCIGCILGARETREFIKCSTRVLEPTNPQSRKCGQYSKHRGCLDGIGIINILRKHPGLAMLSTAESGIDGEIADDD